MAAGSEEGERRRFVRVVRELCAREGLFPPGSRALVMVSGGQDSLALLEMLATGLLGSEGPAGIVALHVNHQLRGQDSLDDQVLVEAHCARLNVELVVAPGRVEKSAGNVQEEARRIRREAALRWARERNCARIALGHTLDDQVETMLYRMGRYGGLPALRGMLPSDAPWVRPLLGVRRADTETFCRGRGLEYAVDKGNVYPGYARTGLREKVVPAWEAALPGAAEAAARTAEVAAEAERALASLLEGTGVSLQSPDLEVFAVGRLPVPVRRLLLHAWLDLREGLESTRADVLAVEGLVMGHGPGELDLGNGWRASREYDVIRLSRSGRTCRPQAASEAVVLPVPGWAVWKGARVRAEVASRFCAPDPEHETYLDASSFTEPLLVRGIVPGDRMRPLGLHGSRKLQDILVDLRVPARRRSSIPVVVCGETILWVCGLVSAEQGRITAQTMELVRLSVEREHVER